MNKTFLVLLVAANLIWAEGSSKQPTPAELFEGMKTIMAPAFKQMIPVYGDLSRCYQKKSSKKNYVFCTKSYGPKVAQIIKTSLGGKGLNGKKSIVPTDKELDAFAWTKEFHNNTIASLEGALNQMKRMEKCLTKSKNINEFNRCSQQK